ATCRPSAAPSRTRRLPTTTSGSILVRVDNPSRGRDSEEARSMPAGRVPRLTRSRSSAWVDSLQHPPAGPLQALAEPGRRATPGRHPVLDAEGPPVGREPPGGRPLVSLATLPPSLRAGRVAPDRRIGAGLDRLADPPRAAREAGGPPLRTAAGPVAT